MQKIAVIDIGTHSILFLLAGRNAKDNIIPLHQQTRSVRLGRNVDTDGIIHEQPLAEAIDVLKQYKKLSEKRDADRIISVATQALRSAENKTTVCNIIRKETDLDVRILTETQEAEASYRGASNGRDFEGTTCVLDIGGGSTEAILGYGNTIIDSISVSIGAVGLTERFIHSDPPGETEFDGMLSFIVSSLKNTMIPILKRGERLIGVGGTITTLAAIDQQMTTYDPNLVDGYVINHSRIEDILAKMKGLQLAERKKMVKTDPSRADILLAGTIILRTIMTLTGFEDILVSDRGLRWGIALKEFYKIEQHQA